MLGSRRVPPEKVSEEMGTAREKPASPGPGHPHPSRRPPLRMRASGNGKGRSLGKDRRIPEGRQRGGGRGSGPQDTEKCLGWR